MNRRTPAVAALLATAALMIGLTGASAGDTPCNGTITGGTINGNVKAGPGCDLEMVTVNGEVKVMPGGSLIANQTTITKNVDSNGAQGVTLFKTSVGGNVHVEDTTGDVYVRFGLVHGNVDIKGSSFQNVSVQREMIGGDVHVHDNAMVSGGDSNLIFVAQNTIEGNLEVKHNLLATAANNQIQVLTNGHIAGNLDVSDNTLAGSFASTSLYTLRNTVEGNVNVDHNSVSGDQVVHDVSGNTITKELGCDHNSPPPTDGLGVNTAKKKKGECANL